MPHIQAVKFHLQIFKRFILNYEHFQVEAINAETFSNIPKILIIFYFSDFTMKQLNAMNFKTGPSEEKLKKRNPDFRSSFERLSGSKNPN